MKNWEKEIGKILLILIGLFFLYSIRKILTPFVLAAILAYILNPFVKLITNKFRIPRIYSVVGVYLVVVLIIIYASTQTGILLAKESRELGKELMHLRYLSEEELSVYPDWARVLIADIANNRELINTISPARLWPYFSGAISGIGSTFIFLVAGFYFLKDGFIFIIRLLEILPEKLRKNSNSLMLKINDVLNNYLRGQIFLVILMSAVSWLVLSYLHVKYSVTLGLFTGVAEIIPIIGPIIAGAAAVLVAMFDGNTMFAFAPMMQGLVIALIYLILRQMEDVFVIPYVLGRTTKLHPLVVLFAVLVGGHLWGILGMVLAVPVVALMRIIVESYFLHPHRVS